VSIVLTELTGVWLPRLLSQSILWFLDWFEIKLDAVSVIKSGYLVWQIAAYRIPRYIRFIEEFPKTPMGKVVKASLRNALITEIRQAARGETAADELI
jgi:acyl-CoA synthetase (AMP-forming)/AMP-acid ligase II